MQAVSVAITRSRGPYTMVGHRMAWTAKGSRVGASKEGQERAISAQKRGPAGRGVSREKFGTKTAQATRQLELSKIDTLREIARYGFPLQSP